MRLYQSLWVIDTRSPRLRVANSLNGEYEKRVCRLKSQTSYRSERYQTSRTKVACLAWNPYWRNGEESARFWWKMPVISGNWLRCACSKTARGCCRIARGLISADQPRDKFMCRPRYIRSASTNRAASRTSEKRKQAVIQDTRASRPPCRDPVRANVFATRARRQYP